MYVFFDSRFGDHVGPNVYVCLCCHNPEASCQYAASLRETTTWTTSFQSTLVRLWCPWNCCVAIPESQGLSQEKDLKDPLTRRCFQVSRLPDALQQRTLGRGTRSMSMFRGPSKLDSYNPTLWLYEIPEKVLKLSHPLLPPRNACTSRTSYTESPKP